MHVATNTPQVSIFEPTNPLNWAPIGEDKHYIRKSDLINDVRLEDVYETYGIIIKNLSIKRDR